MSRQTVKLSAAFSPGATIAQGGAISVSPQTAGEAEDRRRRTASAIVPASVVIVTRLALPTRTRYNKSGLGRSPLWPVLTLSTYGRV